MRIAFITAGAAGMYCGNIGSTVIEMEQNDEYDYAMMRTDSGCFAAMQAADTGFEDLFNGRDFTNWRFSLQKTGDPWPDNWKVKDGVIYLTGLMRPHLVTTKEYGDFEMKFEWRALVPKFNGGFYIRCKPDAGNNQIRVDRNYEGAFLAGTINGAKPVPALQKNIGEWNEWRVLVKGTA